MRKYLLLITILVAGIYSSHAQTRSISGVITNTDGTPLVGATVAVKNQNINTSTGIDGSFTLSVPAGKIVLNISFVGYKAQELTVGAKESKVDITMEVTGAQMEEVVVTGYGVIKGRTVTGAITSVTSVTLYEDIKRKIVDSMRISTTKIYPNPLRKSSLLTIEMKSKMQGNYTVLVSDIGGRHLQMDQFNVESASIQQQIRLKQPIVPGTYIVSIIDPKGKRLSSQKVIVMD